MKPSSAEANIRKSRKNSAGEAGIDMKIQRKMNPPYMLSPTVYDAAAAVTLIAE